MSNKRRSAFSLLETMIAAALLGLIASAVVMVLSFAAREAGGSRLRTIAATNVKETLDRMQFAILAAGHHGVGDAGLCELLTSPTGPMDDTAPATVTGACPGLTLTVANIPIPQTTLRRTVILTDPGTTPPTLRVTVQMINNGTLPPLAEASTIIVREN